jgi:hypothetical protein
MPTGTTTLGRGEPTVNLDQIPAIPAILVVQLTNKLAPSTITNGEGELSVFNHIFDRQGLNGDGLVFTHQLSGQFMEEIFSGVRELEMDLGDFL